MALALSPREHEDFHAWLEYVCDQIRTIDVTSGKGAFNMTDLVNMAREFFLLLPDEDEQQLREDLDYEGIFFCTHGEMKSSALTAP